jgi:hypothetical protein
VLTRCPGGKALPEPPAFLLWTLAPCLDRGALWGHAARGFCHYCLRNRLSGFGGGSVEVKTVDLATPGPNVRGRQEAREWPPIHLDFGRADCSGRFAEAIRPARGLFGRHRGLVRRGGSPRTDGRNDRRGHRSRESTQPECSTNARPGREDPRRETVGCVPYVSS